MPVQNYALPSGKTIAVEVDEPHPMPVESWPPGPSDLPKSSDVSVESDDGSSSPRVGRRTRVRDGLPDFEIKRSIVATIPTLDPGELIDPVVELVNAALDKLLQQARHPDEVEFSVGIKLGVEGGVIVAKGSAEANMTVTLKYSAADGQDKQK